MDENFEAEEVFKKIISGQLDGHLHAQLRRLRYEQLEQIIRLMTEYLQAPAEGCETGVSASAPDLLSQIK